MDMRYLQIPRVPFAQLFRVTKHIRLILNSSKAGGAAPHIG